MSGWKSIFAGAGGQAAGLGIPSHGSSEAPGTGPGGINAGQLQPDSRARNMEAGVPYQLVPAYPPFIRIAGIPGIVYLPKFRTLTFGGDGVAAETKTQTFQFSAPTIIIARTGAGIMADDAAAPVGRTGLDLFKAQMFRAGSTSDLIDAGGGGTANPVALALASTILGTAAQPALIPGNGLFIDVGSFLNVTVQTLIANVEAHVTIWCIEEYGPARG